MWHKWHGKIIVKLQAAQISNRLCNKRFSYNRIILIMSFCLTGRPNLMKQINTPRKERCLCYFANYTHCGMFVRVSRKVTEHFGSGWFFIHTNFGNRNDSVERKFYTPKNSIEYIDSLNSI